MKDKFSKLASDIKSTLISSANPLQQLDSIIPDIEAFIKTQPKNTSERLLRIRINKLLNIYNKMVDRKFQRHLDVAETEEEW